MGRNLDATAAGKHSGAEGAEAVFDELEGRAEGGEEAKVCHHLGKLQPSFDALGCGKA